MDQFLFQEADFEGAVFDAANFVAKYRRVNSLESLKEQLRQYCEVLKQQLYAVINKDYKDFITIATKLDGVDSRVELLRKPLVDLRLDLSLLHDGLLTSKQAIQDTISRKQEVSSKRRQVESALLCLEKLDNVEGIVSPSIGGAALGSSSSGNGAFGGDVGSQARSRRDLLNSLRKAKASGSFSDMSASAFDSSELERAAHALAQAQEAFSSFTQPMGETPVLSASLLGLSKTLNQRLNTVTGQLLARIKARLGDVLAEASSASSGDGAVHVVSESMKRSLAHCLRAVSALNRGDVAESAVSDFIAPLVRSTLTLGRVDGAGGRGSYSGLCDALTGLLTALGNTLSAPLTLAEGVFGDGGDSEVEADLLVRGVWVPVMTVLQERFPGLFSVGIAATLARCYRAVETFTRALVDLIDFGGVGGATVVEAEARRAVVLARVLAHSAVRDVQNRWDLALYSQLRVQEVAARLERACELATNQGLTTNAYEPVHAVTQFVVAAAPVSGGDKDGATVSAQRSLPHTLTSAELTELRAQFLLGNGSFHLPLVLAVAVEAATCFHPQVWLTPLLPELLDLAIRCVARLETHVAATVDVPTPSFSRGAASIAALSGSGSSADHPSTPAKTSTASASVNTPGAPSATGGSPDELVLLAADLYSLARWLKSSLEPRAIALIPSYSAAAKAKEAVSALLDSECERLDATRKAVWSRLVSLLGADCRRGLLAVKAVAGKYRMTNKPAPDSASPYVETVLAPLRLFCGQHGALIAPFAPRHAAGGSWDHELVEDVAANYLLQVQSLLETVKQMDTALQRRSKARAGTNAGAGAGAMTDSEKIALQIALDVKAFGAEINALQIAPSSVSSFALLEAELEKIKAQGDDE